MKSLEGFTSPKTVIEKIEKEIAPKSPEVEIELDESGLKQYGSTVETFIEQQSVDISGEAQQRIERFAQSIEVSNELLESVKAESGIDTRLNEVQTEASELLQKMKNEISAIIRETPTEKTAELEVNLAWKQVLETPLGKEFSDAMNGIIDGEQDVTLSRITGDYSIREFVRKHPQGAQQFNEIFQKEFGKPHPDLSRAVEQITELQQTSPEFPPEDPKYADLAYRIEDDPEYQKFREESDISHKVRVFGTTDFKTIPLDKFMELCSTRANITFSSDREAEKEFRKRFAEKATLYDERERTRVYRDPDGVINRDRDPLFIKMFEPDSRGVGLIHDDALRQFAIRYPEKARGYAEKYPDFRPYTSDIEQKPKPKNTEQTTETIPAQKLSQILEQAEIESKVIKIENGGEFSEAIILPKHEIPTEKMMRLFRGITHLDASLLEQIPYAMRSENESGKPLTLECVRKEVNTLAENPTYENLLAYADKVRPHLSKDEARRLDEDLSRIEDGILRGYSTRKELVFKQFEHSGGWGESGISPYISASSNPYEAAGYGKKGLIVIDLPVSQIESLNTDSTEINIKGTIDKQYISAILLRNRRQTRDEEEIKQEISRALSVISENIEVSLYDTEEMQAVREKQLADEVELDKQQWQKDVEAVRQKRVEKLVKEFPEVKIDFQNVRQISTEQGVDVYEKNKTDIFNYYITRLGKIGRGGKNIEDYEFLESEFGERKKFDRSKINDTMLIKLRELVQRLEQRELERNRAQNRPQKFPSSQPKAKPRRLTR